MNFSSLPINTISGKLLRFPLNFIPKETVVPILQGRLRGKKWIVGSSDHGCWLGCYEESQRRVFEATVKKGSVVFDIGAHVGFYTLLSSELVGPEGRVIAFEPLPSNMHYLRQHLSLNRAANVITLDAAVTDRDSISPFAEGLTSSQGHLSATGRHIVRTVSLDTLLARGIVPAPAFIKIDVEGGEGQAIAGAIHTLAALGPTIFLSTHGRNQNSYCVKQLHSLGYILRPLDATTLEGATEILAIR